MEQRKSHTGWFIVVGVLGGSLVLCCAGVVLINNSTASSGPLFPDVPTDTVAPPTATPATTEQAITDIANNILGSGASVTFSHGTATITYTLTATLDPATTAEDIKNGTFQLMQQLYTSGLPIQEVDYNVNGPLVDQYGNTSVGPYAQVILTATTAKLFNWSNLNQDTAWPDYDTAWVRTS